MAYKPTFTDFDHEPEGHGLSSSSSKVKKVMHEFKEGTLHSGSKHGPKVTSRAQGIAIALSEARHAKGKALHEKKK